jgi:hypothetical protein
MIGWWCRQRLSPANQIASFSVRGKKIARWKTDLIQLIYWVRRLFIAHAVNDVISSHMTFLEEHENVGKPQFSLGIPVWRSYFTEIWPTTRLKALCFPLIHNRICFGVRCIRKVFNFRPRTTHWRRISEWSACALTQLTQGTFRFGAKVCLEKCGSSITKCTNESFGSGVFVLGFVRNIFWWFMCVLRVVLTCISGEICRATLW